MGNNNDSLKNKDTTRAIQNDSRQQTSDTTQRTAQNEPIQQINDNTPKTIQNHPLQENASNTLRTPQNQTHQQSLARLFSTAVPSVSHKLCVFCGQRIDIANYPDHVSICTGQEPSSSLTDSYSSKQIPSFYISNDTRTTHRQSQTEIDSTDEDADYSRSRGSTIYENVILFDFHFF